MGLLLAGSVDSYIQFITVLVIFVGVLGITTLTTKWIANYQKQQGSNDNVQVIETARIAGNKYIQIVRIGEKYIAIAVCKDTVTMLGEIPGDQLKFLSAAGGSGFRELLTKAIGKSRTTSEEPKEKQLHDET